MEVVLTGDDTIKINGRSLVDFADGEIGAITYPNELVGVKTGKNGNSLFAFNNTGRQADLVLRLMRGSGDDKFLLNLLTQMKNNFVGFVTLTGQFIKALGNGSGVVAGDTYVMNAGVFTKEVEVHSQSDGSTDQAVAIYHLRFTNAPRVLS